MRKLHSVGTTGRTAAAAIALLAACSSSSSPSVTGGGDDGGGLPDTSVGDGSGDDGTSDDGGGSDGHSDATLEGGGDAAGDSAPITDASADMIVIVKNPDADAAGIGGQCPTGHNWVAGPVQVSDTIARFSGVTPTGLTAAWTRAGTGDGVAADRLNAVSAFTKLAFLLPGTPAGSRQALDSTGTLVLGLDSSSLYTQIWQRPDTTSGWQLSMAATTPFDAIVGAVGNANATWSEPVFGASGDRLLYLVTPATGAPAMYESQWDTTTSAWGVGTRLHNVALASVDATHRRRPTGMSADDLTLFFFDEVAGVESAAWRTSTSQDFSYFETIAVAPEAAPNLDCTTLYFLSTAADGGTGIAIAQ